MKLIQVITFCSSVALSMLSFAEEVPEKAKALIPIFQSWGENAVLVDAVKAHNAKGISLEEIQAQDKSWRAASGVNDFMKTLMTNSAAQEMTTLEQSKPYLLELFLMDNQGANVAMTNKTSDYWQGDEAKFTESFKGGAGAVHLGEVEFDESAQAYLVQISVPVMDAGKAIGAITIGINLDEL